MLEREKYIHPKTKLDFFRQPEKTSSSSFFIRALSTHFSMLFFIGFSVLIFNQQAKEQVIIKPLESKSVPQPLLKNSNSIQQLTTNFFVISNELNTLTNAHQALLIDQTNLNILAKQLHDKDKQKLLTEEQKKLLSFISAKEKFNAQILAENELVIQNLKNEIAEINKSIKILSNSK